MKITAFIITLICATLPCAVVAFTISFDNNDFAPTPTFSNVQTFSFNIDVAAPLATGVFTNPVLNSVIYNVAGSLVSNTPSGFTNFALERTIGGAEFYAQGSSLRFEIAPGADLSDGVQVSDLDELADFALPSMNPDPLLSEVTGSTNPVFVFNGRELNSVTGLSRFHPTLFVLNSDGTGSMRNSNNVVNLNGFDEIPFGSEYVTDLVFEPSLTISSDAAIVPVPAALWLFGSALGMMGWLRRVATLR